MKTLRAWLPVFFTIILFAAPLFANAQLVPQCGITDPSEPLSAVGCDLCDFGKLLQNIINFMITGVALPLAALLFAYAGVLYVTGGSNPGRITKARKIFKNVLIGFLIAVSGWLVVNTIMTVVFSKDFFTGAGWYELECVQNISKNPEDGQRLIGTSISDLIKVIIPGSKAPPYKVFTTNPDGSGGFTTCPEGAVFNPERNSCVTVDTNVPVAPVTPTGGGPLCTNSYCSVEVLQSEGLTSPQAAAMSCIAMTESGGNPNIGCSASATPCGLYQINNGNWNAYAPTGCEPYAKKHDGTCNRHTALIMLKTPGLGYQPWTGRDKNGVHWNPKALTCVQKYDPGTTLRVI